MTDNNQHYDIQSAFMDYFSPANFDYSKISLKELHIIDLVEFDKKYGVGKAIKSNASYTFKALRECLETIEKQVNNSYILTMIVTFKNTTLNGEDPLINNLSVKDLNKIVTIVGSVVTTSDLKIEYKVEHYICSGCGARKRRKIRPGIIYSQPFCNCDEQKEDIKTSLMERNEELSEIITRQYIKLLDIPEKSTELNPHELLMYVTEPFLNTASHGQRVKITGILRIDEDSMNRKATKEKYFEVIHIESCVSQIKSLEMTEDLLAKLKGFIADKSFRELLRYEFAPHIYGLEDAKDAILLQLFSGSRKPGVGGGYRKDIHIILLGDPGVGKSTLARRATEIAPKSVFLSGGNSTGPGLLGTVVKDEKFGWFLQSGVLTQTNKGLVVIDEYDKLSDETRKKLNEAMEAQKITITKATIRDVELLTECSILAVANPKHGFFNSDEPIRDQFNFDPTVLSRFDFIVVFRDVVDKEKDSKILSLILDRQKYGDEISTKKIFTDEELKKYIAYGKSLEVSFDENELKEKFAPRIEIMRNMNKGTPSQTTHRINEGLLRIAEAFARQRLSTTISSEDADNAIDLYERLNKLASGELNFDSGIENFGETRKQKLNLLEKVELLYDFMRETPKTEKEIDNYLKEKGETHYSIENIKHRCKQEGMLILTKEQTLAGERLFKLVRR